MSALAALLGYLIGSLPTAGLLGRLWGIDLRSQGSGNPGTANALRTSGPWLAAAVLVVEASKGYAAVSLGDWLAAGPGAVAAGLGAVAGNVYNLWYRFRGGKGLGISAGVLAALWPLVLLPVVIVITVGMVATRSSGTAALVAMASLVASSLLWPVTGWPTGGMVSGGRLTALSLGIAAIITWKHWRDSPLSSPFRRSPPAPG